MVTRAAIVDAARGWIGVRWRHQGRGRDGIDCVGLLVMVGRDLGVSDADETGYRRAPEGQGFPARLTPHMSPIRVTEAGPGDVLVFRDPLYPCHVGIRAARDGVATVIHAHVGRRVVQEEPLTGDLRARVTHAFRVPGLVDDGGEDS